MSRTTERGVLEASHDLENSRSIEGEVVVEAACLPRAFEVTGPGAARKSEATFAVIYAVRQRHRAIFSVTPNGYSKPPTAITDPGPSPAATVAGVNALSPAAYENILYSRRRICDRVDNPGPSSDPHVGFGRLDQRDSFCGDPAVASRPYTK